VTRPLIVVLAASAAALERDRRHDRARTARAHHEVRGPLCAARVALATLDPTPTTRAIDTELARAARVLDDHDAHTPLLTRLLPARLIRRGVPAVMTGRSPTGVVVDLAALVREAEPVWRALAASRGRRLVLEAGHGPVLVDGEPGRCLQAAANLVRNAIDHGQGVIRVSAAGGRLTVIDEGNGPAEPLPRLLEAARRRRTRHGHGLAVAAAVAAEHGGRLTADGARLVLDLPTRTGP